MSVPLTRNQVLAEIERIRGHWPSMPRVTVVDGVSELPCAMSEHCAGLYRHESKDVFIVASKMQSSEHLQRVMAHECVLHHSLLEMLGNYGFSKLRVGIEALEADGDPTICAIAENVDQRYGPLAPEKRVAEIVAAAGERCLDRNGNIAVGFGFMKEVYAGIANWLRDHGISVRFTNLELQGLMHVAGQRLMAPAKEEIRNDVIVASGHHSGRILEVERGIAVQKIGRSGEQVTHLLGRLSRPVAVGDVVDINYRNGLGQVGEPAREIER